MFLKLLILLMIYVIEIFQFKKFLLHFSGFSLVKKFVRKKANFGNIKILMFTKTW